MICVDSMILAQFTNAAAPFTANNASTLRTIPDNKILLVAGGSDKPVKIVDEDYIRVKEVDANDNNLNRMEYVFGTEPKKDKFTYNEILSYLDDIYFHYDAIKELEKQIEK